MIKDTFFSFSRFGKLFYKEISENWKLYGLQVLVMYVAMAITLIWYSYTDYTSFNTLAKTNDLNVHIFTLVFWMWSWWIFICLGTSFAFKTMKGKTGRITMLMTPVTAFAVGKPDHAPAQIQHGGLKAEPGTGAGLIKAGGQLFSVADMGVF